MSFAIKFFLQRTLFDPGEGLLQPRIPGTQTQGSLKTGRGLFGIARLHRHHPPLPEGVRMVGTLAQEGSVKGIGLRESSPIFHLPSEVVQGVGMAGIEGQGLPVFADGLVVLPLTCQNRPQVIVGVRIFRVGPDGLTVMRLLPFSIPFPEQRMGQIAALPDSRR